MGKWLMRLGAMVLAAVVLVVTGCPPKEAEESSKGTVPKKLEPPASVSQPEKPVKKEPIPIKVAETTEQLDPTPTAIPTVNLPGALKETCLVTIGNAMPDGELTTVGGEKTSLAERRGKNATVVFFWTAGNSEIAEKSAALSLADLQGDAQAAYGDKGLAVLAINPKDTTEKVKQIAGATEVDFPILIDASGNYFSKIATEKLPRVYVLDASGKIVWLDLEFSEVSREALEQTLRVMLGEPDNN